MCIKKVNLFHLIVQNSSRVLLEVFVCQYKYFQIYCKKTAGFKRFCYNAKFLSLNDLLYERKSKACIQSRLDQTAPFGISLSFASLKDTHKQLQEQYRTKPGKNFPEFRLRLKVRLLVPLPMKLATTTWCAGGNATLIFSYVGYHHPGSSCQWTKRDRRYR